MSRDDASVVVLNDYLIARAPYELRHALKAIPGAKWLASAAPPGWAFPASPAAAKQLADLLGSAAFKGDAEALDLLASGIAASLSSSSKIAKAADQGELEPLPWPTPIPPWAHQLGMVRFAEPLAACLWNVGMGAGKTRAALDLIRLRRTPRVLVIATLAVVPAWEEQAERYAAGAVRLTALPKGAALKRSKLAMRTWMHGTEEQPAIVVVNYECAVSPVFLGMAAAVANLGMLVLDEAHKLKSPNGLTSKKIGQLAMNIPYRLALTGTPMPHSPMDAYGIFRSLDPGIFGRSFVSFRARYAVLGGFQGKVVVGYQNREDFAKRIAPITYEVSRDVLDLPEATHVDRTFELDAASAKIYKELKDELVSEVGGGLVTAANALTRLLRLSQVASGHVGKDVVMFNEDGSAPVRETVEIHTDKQRILEEILEEIADDEPVVVFARFRHDLDQIKRAAVGRGGSCELSGRANELATWQDKSGPRVLAAQLQSGAEGVDLTRARYCVFYSLDYSLGRYDQALARVHRPGQKHPVTYIHIVATGTVDQLVRKALTARRNVVEDVMDEIRRFS